MTSPGLDREAITALLQELNDELGRRGARADLFLVGGAALALVYDATRSTRSREPRYWGVVCGSSVSTRLRPWSFAW